MDIDKVTKMISGLPPGEQEELFAMLGEYEESAKRERCQEHFIPFVKEMWPGFIDGRHHQVMAKKFEEIAAGTCKRLIINMPPRHTKSEFGSYMLPAWFVGKFPEKKVIQCSNTGELAVGFGRKTRNLVDSAPYAKIFPGVNLRHDSKAAGRWAINERGEYFAIGVGGTVTGKGADLLIIDDPHSEQEAKLAATNPEIFDQVYEWYTSGPRQRLQPNAAIVIIMCMVGDTDVLMADGSMVKLRDLNPGDMVATYEGGRITTAKVNNWRSSGVDSIYTVQTQSGIILRANERHPFLVDANGELKWIRLRDLKPGMQLVATKDVVDRQGRNASQGSAPRASQRQAITGSIKKRPRSHLGITANGKASNADVASQSHQRDYVHPATKNNILLQSQPQNKTGQGALNIGTEFLTQSTTAWLLSAITGVMSAASTRLRKILGRTGTENSASTTITTPGLFVDCSATTATSPLVTGKHPKNWYEPLNTYVVTRETIASITPAGEEEVFDVEIDRTENFIANGVVSHNTRWSKRDLTGKILKSSFDRDGDTWEVIDFPAILPSGNPLWPEFWSLRELEVLRNELPAAKWNAQYQQQPTSEEGAIVKREWWKIWEKEDPPNCAFTIQSWDTAFMKNERADYSACTTWGVFYPDEDIGDPNIILLDAFKRRMEFPELKQKAFSHYKEWLPDAFIVEAKAAGSPLIYELRQMGIPVSEFTPTRGNDKIVRVNSVADFFASGKVWAPPTRWAEEVMEEMAAFPNSEHDDLVDSSTQALIRFRKGGFIRLDSDEQDEPTTFRRRKSYY